MARPSRTVAFALLLALLWLSTTAGATVIPTRADAPTVDGSVDRIWRLTGSASRANLTDAAGDPRGQLRAIDNGTHVFLLVKMDEAVGTNTYDDDPPHGGCEEAPFRAFETSDQLRLRMVEDGGQGRVLRDVDVDYVDRAGDSDLEPHEEDESRDRGEGAGDDGGDEDDGEASTGGGVHGTSGMEANTSMTYSLAHHFDTQRSHNGEPGWIDPLIYELAMPRPSGADDEPFEITVGVHVSPNCLDLEVVDGCVSAC